MKRISANILRCAMVMVMAAIALGAVAQSDIQLTQYWAVPTLYNPAAAGSGAGDYVRIRGGARLQWLGIENAPKSFFALADSPLKVGRKRIGAGVNMSQESLGLFSNMLLNLQGAYKLKVFKGELSIGVQGGYFNQKFRGSEIVTPGGDDYHDSNDDALPNQDLNGSSFDISAGLFYTKGNVWAGVSGLHLLEPTVKMSIDGTETGETMQFESTLPRMLYFMGGGNFDVKNTLFEMRPSILVKTDFSTFTAEATVRGVYNKFLSFGLGYRWKDAVSVMIGAEIKNFFLGYAYDYPISAIGKVSSGSHELIGGYQLKLDFSGKNKNKHRSIRLM